MQLSQFLDFEAIRVDLAAGNKRQLLNQLSQIAAARLSVDPPRIYALVARLAAPIDYKAIDGTPVDLVFLLLSPPDAGAEHLKALAAVSRLVRHGATVEKLRGARSRDAMAAVLMGAEERDAA